MKRVYLATLIPCLVIVLAFLGYSNFFQSSEDVGVIRVGFVFDHDESTSYTYNFSLARDELARKYGEDIEILTRSNVPDDATDEPLRELSKKGCSIIFINGYSPQVLDVAREFPDVQFCQASWMDIAGKDVPRNYHSFKGEAYQARYVSGIAAGMVLRSLIDQGTITPAQALVGFVSAFQNPEVISGYTAFFMGIRSVAPEAVMHVRCTGTWSSFSEEKRLTEELLDEGCVVISQHCDTIGPALACEEAAATRNVYYVSYNQSLQHIAPRSALVCARINWVPYITSAVEAVKSKKTIERYVTGSVHGNDMSAGFDHGWVEVSGLHVSLAAPGTQEAVSEAIAQFRRGQKKIAFQTDATAISRTDPSVTLDLKNGYSENTTSSYPSFDYLLPDLIEVR